MQQSVQNTTDEVVKRFTENVREVEQLLGFDSLVIESCLDLLESARQNAESSKDLKSRASANLLGALQQSVKNIKTSDRLKPSYQTFYNQCLVLLVSHFGAALEDLFRKHIVQALKLKTVNTKMGERELRVRLDTLVNLPEDDEDLSEVLFPKEEHSFQDMQSIRRMFDEAFGCEINGDTDMHDIILAQACRHVIVHVGAKADSKLLRQLRSINKRTIKTQLDKGDSILFTPPEINQVSTAMKRFLSNYADQIKKALSQKN